MPRKYRSSNKTNKKQVFSFLFILILLFSLYLLIDNRLDHSFKYNPSEYTTTQTKIGKKNNVNEAIVNALELLSVPEKKYSRSKENEFIQFRIGINGQIMDLNFANSIITGQIELSGGDVITGLRKNNGNKQILKYYDPDQELEYQVILYYSKYGNKIVNTPKLAIVIDDFGFYKGELLADFCSLNKNLTFAIIPHQKYSKDVMEQAHQSGHELIIHMPMEPINYPRINPGPDAIYTHLSSNEIQKRVQGYIKNLPLCVGANNHMGSLATADKDVMKSVLSVLKKHGLYFIDSRTSQVSIAYQMAREMMLPSFENTLFLDTPKISDETLQIKLTRLKSLITKRDKIVIITHCASRKHYQYLKTFLKEIEDMDIELVPASGLFESELPDIL